MIFSNSVKLPNVVLLPVRTWQQGRGTAGRLGDVRPLHPPVRVCS